MSDRKEIVLAFFRIRVTRNRTILRSIKKGMGASRQHFMDIGLMGHIKNQLICGGIKDFMQRNRHLNHPQIGAIVPPMVTDFFQ